MKEHRKTIQDQEHLRLKRLIQRQQIIASIREDLYEQKFLEIETPLMVKHPTPDLYIDSFSTEIGYLITSTEYQVKRLIAEGINKVFTLGKNFRANERGPYHSTEFTMLEWGRAYESLSEIEEDTLRFIRKAFRRLYPEKSSLVFNGNVIDIMSKPWERLTVREAFQLHLGISNPDDFSLNALCEGAKQAKIQLPPHFLNEASLVMSFLLDLLQSKLGKKTPTFLQEWPSYLTCSTPPSSQGHSLANRTELYIGGIEIANGFPFLTDSEIQRRLFEEQRTKRNKIGFRDVTLDEKYLDALNHLPPGAGMALGIDRLTMVLTEATCLADVQAFDWDEL